MIFRVISEKGSVKNLDFDLDPYEREPARRTAFYNGGDFERSIPVSIIYAKRTPWRRATFDFTIFLLFWCRLIIFPFLDRFRQVKYSWKFMESTNFHFSAICNNIVLLFLASKSSADDSIETDGIARRSS